MLVSKVYLPQRKEKKKKQVVFDGTKKMDDR